MIFSYTTSLSEDKITPELAIIPTVVGPYSPPVAIRSLVQTSNAVFYIGPKEAIVVEGNSNSLIITPILPANLYLTPDTTERPGVQAAKLMINTDENGKIDVSFSRERIPKWLKWDPIAEQRA